MKKAIAILVLSSAFCFSGCEMVSEFFAPKFDATSVESFNESYEKIQKSLNADESQKLNEALTYQYLMYIKDHPGEALVALGAAVVSDDTNNNVTKSFSHSLMKTFDGKSAKQVIQEYETAKAQK